MKKIGIVLVLSIPSLHANSSITQWATGPGFNVYRSDIEIVLPGGKWSGQIPPQILPTSFPDGATFAAQVQAYDTQIGGKLAALLTKLRAEAQKNPLWAQTLAKIAALDKQVATESAKKANVNPQLQQAYTQAQQDYAATYESVAHSAKEYQPFQTAWKTYEQCLQSVKQQWESKEGSVMQALSARGLTLQNPDTVFLIGERLHLNLGKFDPQQIPAAASQVLGAANLPPVAKFVTYLLTPSTNPKCEPLRQAAAKAYATLDAVVQQNPQVKAKNTTLSQALASLNASQGQAASTDKVAIMAVARRLGMEFQYISLQQVVLGAANSIGLVAELQKYQQALPADLKSAQQAYDAKADQAIDALDASIQKIVQQQQQAQIAH